MLPDFNTNARDAIFNRRRVVWHEYPDIVWAYPMAVDTGVRMRLAKLTYDQLSPDQKVAWDEVVDGPRKKMHGPFFIWLHSADLLRRGQNLGLYARFQSSLHAHSCCISA